MECIINKVLAVCSENSTCASRSLYVKSLFFFLSLLIAESFNELRFWLNFQKVDWVIDMTLSRDFALKLLSGFF